MTLFMQTARKMLESDFKQFQKWAHDKKIIVNKTKTKGMHITGHQTLKLEEPGLKFHSHDCLHNKETENCLCENTIELVEHIKYLGIIFDHKFLWNIHIEETCKRMRYIAYKIFHLSDMMPKYILKTIYHSLVESVLGYAITVWGRASNTHLLRLSGTQNRIIKHLHFDKTTPTQHIYRTFEILDIKKLFIYRTTVTNYTEILKQSRIDHVYETRANARNDTEICSFRNKYGKRTDEAIYGRILNAMPQQLRQLKALCQIKQETKQWLLKLDYELL